MHCLDAPYFLFIVPTAGEPKIIGKKAQKYLAPKKIKV